MSHVPNLRFAPMRRPRPVLARSLVAGRLVGLTAFASLLCAVGCEPAPDPAFADPEGYGDLMEEVRTGMHAEVEDYDTGEMVERDLPGFDEGLRVRFGTPAQPAVLTSLPVRFGSREVAIVEATDDEAGEQTVFSLAPMYGADALPTISAGETLHWNDEFGNPHTAEIVSAAGKTLTVPLVAPEHVPIAVPEVFDEETGDPVPPRAVIGAPDLLTHGRELYVVHCQHCHGATGAGDGPTAKYLHPLPRDYRKGIYKFTSTGSGLASRTDLTRVLREGIPGTYMPSFHPALDEEQMAAVVEYVRWLSMRGQYAKRLVDETLFLYAEADLQTRMKEEELTRQEILDEAAGFWQDDVAAKLGLADAYGLSPLAESWTLIESDDAVAPQEPRAALTAKHWRIRSLAAEISIFKRVINARPATGPADWETGPRRSACNRMPRENRTPFPVCTTSGGTSFAPAT